MGGFGLYPKSNDIDGTKPRDDMHRAGTFKELSGSEFTEDQVWNGGWVLRVPGDVTENWMEQGRQLWKRQKGEEWKHS